MCQHSLFVKEIRFNIETDTAQSSNISDRKIEAFMSREDITLELNAKVPEKAGRRVAQNT